MAADSATIAHQYRTALETRDTQALEALCDELVTLRRWGIGGLERHRGRGRVVECYRREWQAWADPKFVCLSMLGGDSKAAIEYQVQVTVDGRLIEYNRAEFLTCANGVIEAIDAYLPEAIPSGPRGGDALTDIDVSNVDALLDSLRYSFSVREWMPPDSESLVSLRIGNFGGSQPHPASNSVFGARWTAETADAEIEKQINFFRERSVGFSWYLSPLDTPADLGERLVKHGLVFAGSASTMVRLGFDDIETIPVNPDADVLEIPPDHPELYDEGIAVCAIGFHIPEEQVERLRKAWRDRSQNPETMKRERLYLARLGGKAVGYAAMMLDGGHAYLGGAATLPEFRGRKIYSTLLRRRLEDARAIGFQMAMIDAEPMSRRVVTRYGFKEYGKISLYAWMPVIDMEVIRTLVPDE